MPDQRHTSANQEAEVFSRAIEIRSPDEQSAYLDAACGTNGELRARLNRLLGEHENPREFFDAPDQALLSIAREETQAQQFGEFEIIREIGRGGMGIVYEARQVSLNRRVALKVLSAGQGFRTMRSSGFSVKPGPPQSFITPTSCRFIRPALKTEPPTMRWKWFAVPRLIRCSNNCDMKLPHQFPNLNKTNRQPWTDYMPTPSRDHRH